MALTLTELQQKLALIDEISVLEILEITSEDLANRFMDKIEIKYDQLITEFEEYSDAPEEGDTNWWEYDVMESDDEQ